MADMGGDTGEDAMGRTLQHNDSIDDKEPLVFPPEVQAALSEVFSSDQDPLDEPDFNAIAYINELFPTEQSLANLDDSIAEMRCKIGCIDDDLRHIVRGQGDTSKKMSVEDASVALAEAQSAIVDLFSQIHEIKNKAQESENTVRDITRDIKQLDAAKRNLTSAITTLNHLHMLVGGVTTLKKQKDDRQYGDAANLLQGLQEVISHFNSYSDIPQIKDLATQVKVIQGELGEQILGDFQRAFAADNAKNFVPSRQLAEACLVVSVLEPKYKRSLLKFLLQRELAEYSIVFSEGEESAWLDRIDERYNWLKRHLIEFEERLAGMFPPDWEMSERIAVEFCHLTNKDLEKAMFKRKHEIDTKLLLHAVQRTANFEALLSRRFTGITLSQFEERLKEEAKAEDSNPFKEEEVDSLDANNPFFEDGDDEAKQSEGGPGLTTLPNLTPFHGVISKCFEPYLHIYIESQDQNLVRHLYHNEVGLLAEIIRCINLFQIDLIDRAASEQKKKGHTNLAVEGSSVLHSCGDLFMFYKKCMVQCAQLSTGEPMLALTNVFKKHLKEYASKVLLSNLPKIGCEAKQGATSSTASAAATLSSMTTSLMTRELKDFSAQGLMRDLQSILKEGDSIKLHPDERVFICSVIVTSEYIIG